MLPLAGNDSGFGAFDVCYRSPSPFPRRNRWQTPGLSIVPAMAALLLFTYIGDVCAT